MLKFPTMERIKRIISSDSHVREPADLWQRTVSNELGERTPRPVDYYNGIEGSFFYTGQHVVRHLSTDATKAESDDARILIEAGYDPEVRVTFQVRAGIEAELLFPTLFSAVMQVDDAPVVQSAAGAYNDWIAEYCAYDPKRLIGTAVVPLHEPEWSIAELDRARTNGLRTALINTVAPKNCPPLRDASYDRFWSAAEDLEMPVLIHIVTGRVQDPIVYAITPEQLAEAPKGIHEMWHEVQTTLSNEFIFGGILDRHPKLKLIDAEYDISWLLYFMFRDDQIHEQFRGILELPSLKMKPSEYLTTRVWHGMTDDPFGIDTIRRVGADCILWGSDFPHVRSVDYNTRKAIADLYGELPTADQRKLVGENAARLFGLS